MQWPRAQFDIAQTVQLSIVSIHNLLAIGIPLLTIIIRQLIVGIVAQASLLASPPPIVASQVNELNQKNVLQSSQQQNWLLGYETRKTINLKRVKLICLCCWYNLVIFDTHINRCCCTCQYNIVEHLVGAVCAFLCSYSCAAVALLMHYSLFQKIIGNLVEPSFTFLRFALKSQSFSFFYDCCHDIVHSLHFLYDSYCFCFLSFCAHTHMLTVLLLWNHHWYWRWWWFFGATHFQQTYKHFWFSFFLSPLLGSVIQLSFTTFYVYNTLSKCIRWNSKRDSDRRVKKEGSISWPFWFRWHDFPPSPVPFPVCIQSKSSKDDERKTQHKHTLIV